MHNLPVSFCIVRLWLNEIFLAVFSISLTFPWRWCTSTALTSFSLSVFSNLFWSSCIRSCQEPSIDSLSIRDGDRDMRCAKSCYRVYTIYVPNNIYIDVLSHRQTTLPQFSTGLYDIQKHFMMYMETTKWQKHYITEVGRVSFSSYINYSLRRP